MSPMATRDPSHLVEIQRQEEFEATPKTCTASYFQTVKSKFAKREQRSPVPTHKPYPQVNQVRADNETPVSPRETESNEIFTIYNPPAYDEGPETEEEILTDCESAKIIPSAGVNSSKKWAGIYFGLVGFLVVGSVLFAVVTYEDPKDVKRFMTFNHS